MPILNNLVSKLLCDPPSKNTTTKKHQLPPTMADEALDAFETPNKEKDIDGGISLDLEKFEVGRPSRFSADDVRIRTLS